MVIDQALVDCKSVPFTIKCQSTVVKNQGGDVHSLLVASLQWLCKFHHHLKVNLAIQFEAYSLQLKVLLLHIVHIQRSKPGVNILPGKQEQVALKHFSRTENSSLWSRRRGAERLLLVTFHNLGPIYRLSSSVENSGSRLGSDAWQLRFMRSFEIGNALANISQTSSCQGPPK